MRVEERTAGLAYGLQPVQLQVLYYLFHCNKYSNTPAAVTEYLGSTKGTVSQTLLLLESKGYLEKTVDEKDRRVVHLGLTSTGNDIVKNTLPPTLFDSSIRQMSETEVHNFKVQLNNFLRYLQRANDSSSFGICRTCNHFMTENNRFRCGLTNEPLKKIDSEKICREHTTP